MVVNLFEKKDVRKISMIYCEFLLLEIFTQKSTKNFVKRKNDDDNNNKKNNITFERLHLSKS